MAIMAIPSKLYVARKAYSAEEIVGFIVVADKDHTKGFETKKASADRWAGNKNMPITINNDPRTGFQMVTNVSRYRTKNVLWRVRHPEGFEFEITSDNMCDLLATNTVINGVFQDELFFTESRQLVSTKTELFADMVKKEQKDEERKQAAKDLYEGAGFVFEGYKGKANYVYCGKYHAMSVNKNKCLLQPTKSTLTHIIKNIETGLYVLRSSLDNIEFSTSKFLDQIIDREKVIQEVNDYYWNWYNPNITVHDALYDYKVPMVVNNKPFKMSDVYMHAEEIPVQSMLARGVSDNKVFEIKNSDKTYRIFGSMNTNSNRGGNYYNNQDYNSTDKFGDFIFGYAYPELEDGHLDYSETDFSEHQSFSGWRSRSIFATPFRKHYSHEKNNSPVLSVFKTPEVLTVKTYRVKGV